MNLTFFILFKSAFALPLISTSVKAELNNY